MESIDNMYINAILISIDRRMDFCEAVESADLETRSYVSENEKFLPQGYDGLFFLESLLSKIGSSIGECFNLLDRQKNEIIEDILNMIHTYEEGYEEYYHSSNEEEPYIEFKGHFSYISTRDEIKLLRYYNSFLKDVGTEDINVHTRYGITFKRRDMDCDDKYSITVSVMHPMKSEYMYDSFVIWTGQDGVPAEFIDEVIENYNSRSNHKYIDEIVQLEKIDNLQCIDKKERIEVEKVVIESPQPDEDELENEELICYLDSKTKTMEVFNEFEGIGDKFGLKYRRIVIDNAWISEYTPSKNFHYHLVIERGHGRDYVGDITMTQLKREEDSDLIQYIKSQVNRKVENKYYDKDDFFHFSKPYLLRAQNKRNRSGYGWEWDWSGGRGSYTEGTLYGETTNYFIVGVYISSSYRYRYSQRCKSFYID